MTTHRPVLRHSAALVCLTFVTTASAQQPSTAASHASSTAAAATEASTPVNEPAPEAPQSGAPALTPEKAAVPEPAPSPDIIETPELAQGAPTSKQNRVARTSPLPLVEPEPPEQTWYGWQTLAVDVASLGALALGVGFDNAFVGLTGIGGYLFAAPAVHWFQGGVGRGFASLGVRFAASALIVVGGVACAGSSFGGGDSRGVCMLPLLGVFLVPASVAIDAAGLSWRDSPRGATTGRALHPWFSAERRAGGVVWQGTF